MMNPDIIIGKEQAVSMLKRLGRWIHHNYKEHRLYVESVLLKLEEAEDCPNCDNTGVMAELFVHPRLGDGLGSRDIVHTVPLQCQFCYENPYSVFNILKDLHEDPGYFKE